MVIVVVLVVVVVVEATVTMTAMHRHWEGVCVMQGGVAVACTSLLRVRQKWSVAEHLIQEGATVPRIFSG